MFINNFCIVSGLRAGFISYLYDGKIMLSFSLFLAVFPLMEVSVCHEFPWSLIAFLHCLVFCSYSLYFVVNPFFLSFLQSLVELWYLLLKLMLLAHSTVQSSCAIPFFSIFWFWRDFFLLVLSQWHWHWLLFLFISSPVLAADYCQVTVFVC